MSRAQLTSTVEQNTGGAVSPVVAGKNFLINGDFSIAQRGTSGFSVPAGSAPYSLDRWCAGSSANSIWTISQVASGLTNFPNAMRAQIGTTSSASISIAQNLETKDSVILAGQTVTLSFYARAGSAWGTAMPVAVIWYGTGTDQNLLINYTGATQASNVGFNMTTGWQKFTQTCTIPSNATEISVNFYFSGNNGTAGVNDYFDITACQLELGSVATPFSRAGGTLSGELAACQRYYWRAGGDSVYQPYAVGAAQSTTTAQFSVQNPVPMRIAPTSIDFSTVAVTDTINAYSISAITFANAGRYASTVNTAASSLTTFRPYIFVSNNSTSGYFGLSAEL